jgi:hypothetical protein
MLKARVGFSAIAAITAGLCAATALLTVSATDGNAAEPLEVAVAPGRSATVALSVTSSTKQSPLDLVFMMDTTGSESERFARSKAALLNTLNSQNPSTAFGIAAAGDVPVFPFGTATDKPYRLVQGRTSDKQLLTDMLASVGPVEGGGDNAEGTFVAIDSLLTNPLEQFTFRGDARRVVIVTADGPPHVPTDMWCRTPSECVNYPGPSAETVQAKLAAADVTLVVLAHGEVGSLQQISQASGGLVIATQKPIVTVPSTTIPPAVITNDVVAPPTMEPKTVEELTAEIQAALASETVAVRPQLADCFGATATFEPAVRRVVPGQPANFTMTVTAGADIAAGIRACSVGFLNGEQIVNISVKPSCEPSSSTTVDPSSILAVPTTTTAANPTSTVADPATTVAEPTTQAVGPSTTVVNPTTTIADPTTTTPDPTTTVAEPATTVLPTTTVADPTTTVAEPTTTLVITSSTVVGPATTTVETALAGAEATTTVAEPTTTVVDPTPPSTIPSESSTTTPQPNPTAETTSSTSSLPEPATTTVDGSTATTAALATTSMLPEVTTTVAATTSTFSPLDCVPD